MSTEEKDTPRAEVVRLRGRLEEIASKLEKTEGHFAADVEDLRLAALQLSVLEPVMASPNLLQEARLEQMLTDYIEDALEDGRFAPQLVALWLIQRRVSSAGSKSLFGAGLGTLGAAALAGAFGGGKEPQDGH
jgi:hypothetical protein